MKQTKEDTIFFDIETTGLDLQVSEFRVSCFREKGDTKFFYTPKETLDYILNLFLNDKTISGHNILKFDFPFLIRKFPVTERDYYYREFMSNSEYILDTLLLFRMATGHNRGNSMSDLCKLLGIKEKVTVEDWQVATMEQLKERVSGDCEIQEKLTEIVLKDFDHELVHNLYPALVPFFLSLTAATSLGIPVNESKIKREYDIHLSRSKFQYNRLSNRLGRTVKTGKNKSKQKSNFNSNFHVDALMRNNHLPGLPLGEPTPKTGVQNPTMNAQNKHIIEDLHPLYSRIYSYRDTLKVLQTLGTESKKSILDQTIDGLCYPSVSLMNQDGLRSSYSSPPLNQLPSNLRYIVQARNGQKFIGFDLKGLEFFTAAYILKHRYGREELWDEATSDESAKQKTLQIFAEWFKVFPEDERLTRAKTVTYALLYGMSISSLLRFFRKKPESDPTELKRLVDIRFPGLSKFSYDLQKEFKKNKFIRNLYGLPIRPKKDYAFLNGWIQSSGCIYAYLYLGHLAERMIPYGPVVVCQHDELLIRVPEDFSIQYLEKVIANLDARTSEMIPTPFITSVKGSVREGKTWSECH